MTTDKSFLTEPCTGASQLALCCSPKDCKTSKIVVLILGNVLTQRYLVGMIVIVMMIVVMVVYYGKTKRLIVRRVVLLEVGYLETFVAVTCTNLVQVSTTKFIEDHICSVLA